LKGLLKITLQIPSLQWSWHLPLHDAQSFG